MTDKLLQVARVAGAFGVKGELRLTSFAQDPAALVDYRELRREDGSVGLTLTSGRATKDGLICRAEQVTTREQAEALRGLKLYVARADLPAPDEDEFYLADLIGLAIESPEGAPIGKVKSVQDFGAGDLIEVIPAEGGATWWLPFTKEAVPEVKLAEGKLIAVPPDVVE